MKSSQFARPDHRFFRATAIGFAVIVAWFAFRPAMQVESGLSWDKANHALAFLGLTVLTGLGWSRLPRVWLFVMMLTAGVTIELVQGLPTIRRDADTLDVVADVVGALAGLLILTVQGIKGRSAA